MTVQVFGIRHHGPGSARSLLVGLRELRPDVVLIEGPPEADPIIPLAGADDLKPPVAILIYPVDEPGRALYYPFAVFSPELQAIRYALAAGVPVRFMDLPAAVFLAQPAPGASAEPSEDASPEPHADPIGWLAQAAGEPDPERWWERMVEQRGSREGLFDSIREAMAALREASSDRRELEEQREAHMRQVIRAAQKEGHERIAVVCGAWHAPALITMPPAAQDARTLVGLSKVKVESTWIPWTHGRLALESGYGAGIESPGWYRHLWDARPDEDVVVTWLARVSSLLRAEDLDASSAQVIDAVRLSLTLAAMRGRSVASLSEVTESVRAVLTFGDDAPVQLIRRKLIVGEELGELPASAPRVPIQQNLEKQQRRLRLKPEAMDRVLELDLRTPNHLQTSQLLHRLRILRVPWGAPQDVAAGKRGTFHETWKLAWKPEFALAVIEAGIWGNTVEQASAARAVDVATHTEQLGVVAELLDLVLLADLPTAITAILDRFRERSALTTDVGQMMDAVPALVNAARYGTVRKTDAALIGSVSEGLLARIFVGLPAATASLDDEAAAEMTRRLTALNLVLKLLEREDLTTGWLAALGKLLDRDSLHGHVAGRAARILLEAAALAPSEVARRLGLAFSRANDPGQAAAWLQGFLEGSGLVLVTDDRLWNLVDGWLAGLRREDFDALLPLLRRTFSGLAVGERRQIADRAKAGPSARAPAALSEDVDPKRAALVEPVLRMLLGMTDG
jgi:Family of unknown function (DUF5682)